MECNELFLNEICHVELVPTENCDMAVPFNVAELTETAGTKQVSGRTVDRIGQAVMVIDVNDVADYAGVLDSAPTLKVTEKPQAAGYLRQHDLTIPTRGDYEKVRQARGRLAGVDFCVVLRTLGGTRFLLYSLPNSSTVSVEDQFGQDSKQTVKVSLQSMSNMIRLT